VLAVHEESIYAESDDRRIKATATATLTMKASASQTASRLLSTPQRQKARARRRGKLGAPEANAEADVAESKILFASEIR
jgi:hypothetical protein